MLIWFENNLEPKPNLYMPPVHPIISFFRIIELKMASTLVKVLLSIIVDIIIVPNYYYYYNNIEGKITEC